MSENSLRCPDIGCPGLISEVSDGDEHFWMCGECGDVWYDRGELDEAIEKIISQFPYRKKVYRKSKGTWLPVPREKEPDDYQGLVEAEAEPQTGEPPLRCPELGCTGWISEVDDGDEHFWGCGECGNVWSDRDELDQAIAEVVSQFPYRKKVYQKSKGTWQPVPLGKEPKDYEELVEAELGDEDDGEDGDDDDDDDDIWWTLACPVSQCDGSLFYSEDGIRKGKYWSCDSCDSSWFDTKNLMKEIAAIIKKFPYREQMYQKTEDGYEPVDWDMDDFKKYSGMVKKEPRDQKAGKKRG